MSHNQFHKNPTPAKKVLFGTKEDAKAAGKELKRELEETRDAFAHLQQSLKSAQGKKGKNQMPHDDETTSSNSSSQSSPVKSPSSKK